jgi:hypothetical protein
MKIQLMLDPKLIRALELFAGDNDVRYYLNGLHVEALDASTAQITVSDGHRIMRHRISEVGPFELTSPEESFPCGGIIPRDVVKGIKADRIVLCVDTVAWRYDVNDGERGGKLIDGKFPDIDRVWPRTVSGEAGQYDPEYLADIGKACKLLGVKYGGTLIQNGPTDAALIVLRHDFAGLLMPMRKDINVVPSWVASTIKPTVLKDNALDLAVALRDLYDCNAAGILPKSVDQVLVRSRELLERVGILTAEQIKGKVAA